MLSRIEKYQTGGHYLKLKQKQKINNEAIINSHPTRLVKQAVKSLQSTD